MTQFVILPNERPEDRGPFEVETFHADGSITYLINGDTETLDADAGEWKLAEPLKALAFGRHTHPEGLRAVWGARLIWPNDLVHDRQDLVASDDAAKDELIAWLNEIGIKEMRIALSTHSGRDARNIYMGMDDEAVIYEDSKGKIIGSTQGRSGYLYVSGWLKAHEETLA